MKSCAALEAFIARELSGLSLEDWKHLTGTLGYQIVVKDSNLPLRDYLQNRVNLDLNYSF